MPAPRAQTVIVSLKSGVDLKGVLMHQDDEKMLLRAAAVAGEITVQGQKRTVWKPLVGETVVPVSNVEYYQTAIPAEVLAQLVEEG